MDDLPAPERRKRLKRRETPGGPRFVTFSCQRRLPLLRNLAISGVFVQSLQRARARWRFQLFAWVVMPEHVHLLVLPPANGELGRVLLWLKMAVAQRVIARWRELDAPILTRIDDGRGSPRFWQKGGGFDRNIRDMDEFTRTVRYIHHNPVERGLVERPAQWLFSSARWWMGSRDGELECDAPPGRPHEWASWKGY